MNTMNLMNTINLKHTADLMSAIKLVKFVKTDLLRINFFLWDILLHNSCFIFSVSFV